MTTTMDRMRDVIGLLVSRGVRDRVRVMVGGAPVTQAYADEIGAEGYGEDASKAVAAANRLMAVRQGPQARHP
jgi:methanogenic corrinoid protein MtbC1